MIKNNENFKKFLESLKFFLILSIKAKNLVLILLLLFLAGFLNIIGFTLLVPLLDILLFNKKQLTENFLIQFIYNNFDFNITFNLLLLLTIISVLLGFFFQAIGNYYSYKLRFKFIELKRIEILNLFSGLKWKSILAKHSGRFNDLVLNQTEQSGAAFFTLYSFWISIIQMFTFGFICILISFKLFIISLGILSLGAFLSLIFQFFARKYSKIYSDGFQNFGKIVSDINNNLKFYKLSQNKNFFLSKAYLFTNIISKNITKTYKLHSIQTFLLQNFTLIVIVMIILFYKKIQVSGSEVLVFLAALRNFSGYLQNVFNNILHFQSYSAPIELIENEIAEMRQAQENSSSIKIKKIENIKFRNVGFSYNKNNVNLFNVNFDLSPGKVFAIFGESGSGKSTVLDLLSLLYNPDQGKIFINDNNSLKICKKTFRDKIGYVSQGATLNEGSIISNLTLDKKISKKKVIDVCKKLKIFKWIQSQKEGFDTIIGEKGNTLSGGQIQRIFLARIILQDPDLLILDEATGALDAENELAINNYIKSEKKNRIIVIVSHKTNTLSFADQFFLVKNNNVFGYSKYKDILTNLV